ncbi:MAG: terminase small subunit [Holophaga sp.]|jgi:phage terminase small subunit
MSKEMTIKQAKFVAAYLSGTSAIQAAIEAGYSPSSARTRGFKLLKENEHVKAAVAEAREKIQAQTGFNAEQAMVELNAGIEFAKKTNNATALARHLELKMKLAGLLDRDRDGGGSSFQINILRTGASVPGPAPIEVSDIFK